MQRLISGIAIFSAAWAAELPVREVILFKHGVGYFERSGQLKPGESARLEFKASEMDDVLKSLTLVDRAGGKITGIRYDSSEPLAKKLSEFPFAVGGQTSLAAFLDQMKGARIELKLGSETVAGAIVSGRVVPANDKGPEREQVVIFVDSGELRTYDLAAAASIRFADPTLQALLKDYLSAVAQGRSRDKRGVLIDAAEGRARDLVAAYMIPTAVWKSSYRLVFSEKDQPTLEGWAIVDNTTGEDWTNVRLAVVSGRPISFISRLYEPRYIERQIAELAENRSIGPVVHRGEIAQTLPAAPPPARAGLGQQFYRQQAAKDEAAAAEATKVTASTLEATAEGRDLGDLFEYRFSGPVTVKRNESAMLPFLQQKINARKLLVYSEAQGSNPLNAAELTNSTGKTLDGGPITVYDSGAYGGEALMETLKTGDRRLISYAVDLGTRVTTLFDSNRDNLREIHYRRGILTTRSAMQETKTYTIRNVDQKPKTLIIEHPKRAEYTLLNQKPLSTTANAYRFEVKLPAATTEKFAVTEERVYETSTGIANLTPDVLVTYIQNKALSAAGRQALEAIAAKKREIATNDTALRQTEQDVRELEQDQSRLRSNISSLNSVSGQQEQVQKYARQLAAQETRLAGLRDTLSEQRKKKTALESELNSLMEKTEF
jgi:hypothetical protein